MPEVTASRRHFLAPPILALCTLLALAVALLLATPLLGRDLVDLDNLPPSSANLSAGAGEGTVPGTVDEGGNLTITVLATPSDGTDFAFAYGRPDGTSHYPNVFYLDDAAPDDDDGVESGKTFYDVTYMEIKTWAADGWVVAYIECSEEADKTILINHYMEFRTLEVGGIEGEVTCQVVMEKTSGLTIINGDTAFAPKRTYDLSGPPIVAHSFGYGVGHNRYFSTPGDMAVDPQGNVYIHEEEHWAGQEPPWGFIKKFDKYGNLQAMYGKGGRYDDTRFEDLGDMAADSAGNLFAVDMDDTAEPTFIIYKFGPGGGPPKTWEIPGEKASIELQVDLEGNVFCLYEYDGETDSEDGALIIKYDNNGQELNRWDIPIQTDDSDYSGRELTFDVNAEGDLFVLETPYSNASGRPPNTIMRYDNDGLLKDVISPALDKRYGQIGVDPAGNIYLHVSHDAIIDLFDTDGSLITELRIWDYDYYPYDAGDIEVDMKGDVYLAEYQINPAVLRYLSRGFTLPYKTMDGGVTHKSESYDGLRRGQYTVSVRPVDDGYILDEIRCETRNGSEVTNKQEDGEVIIDLVDNDDVSCQFDYIPVEWQTWDVLLPAIIAPR